MLTDPTLITHVGSGSLLEWRQLPGAPTRVVRRLLFAPDAFEDFYREPWQRHPEDRRDSDARDRRRLMHSLVQRFVSGGRLAPDADIKLLDASADAVFSNLLEFRSGPPNPQARLFAYVYSPGVWVAFALRYRHELGDLGDPRWANAARSCKGAWDNLFGNRQPHTVKFPLNSFGKLKAICDG